MKKKFESGKGICQIPKKLMLVMKLTAILLVVFTMHVSATVYSQNTKLSLNMKEVSILEVLQQIEAQSEYRFIYENEKVNLETKVSIQVKDEVVENILKKLFKNDGVNYSITESNLILINPSAIQLKSLNKEPANLQQPKTIKGSVKSSNGESLPGVSVSVKGTVIGTITDGNGDYSIPNVSEESVLVFSFIGMKAQEIKVGALPVIDVVMAEESIGIEEVVAIGYGTKSKETLTGAISVVGNDVLESRPVVKTTDLLQGISSGLQITRNNTGNIKNANNALTIRGLTSRSAPGVLIVVDGIAQANTDASALDNINPDDIESISILKDGQAAIYGARAAGGVILVTTKIGKTSKPTINFSASATIMSPSLTRKMTNVLDLSEMQNEGFVNDGQTSNPYTPFWKYISDNHVTLADVLKNDGKFITTAPNDLPYALGNYDWSDIMFDPSLQQNYNFSVSGKTDKVNYYESVSYLDEDGMLAYGTNFKKRLLITLKNDYEVTKFLKIKSNFSIGNQKLVEPFNYSANSYNAGVQGALFFVWPTNQPFTKGGHFNNQGGYLDPIGFAEAAGYTTDLSYIIHGQLGAEITPFKNMVVTTEVSSNYDITESDYASIGFPMYDVYDVYSQMSSDDATTGPNRAGAVYNRNRHSLANFYARYSFENLVNHKIHLMAGYSHEENDFRNFSAERRLGLISAQLPTMSAGSSDQQFNSETKNDYALNSVYSRLEYSFKDRYLFEGVFRYDGSSKFATGHKWSPFFGYSGAWIISDENFMKNLKNGIEFLKIRASWGQLGNQSGIGLYDYLSQVNVGGAYPMGDWNSPSQIQRATLGAMASTTRSWEKIESKNLGIDFRSLNSRLTGSFDAYIKDNKDMFFSQEFPQVLGTTPPSINGAHVRTKGWELELGWRDKIQDFSYFAKLNLANNTNEVIELADAVIPSQGTNTFVQGYPANSYFGLRYDGIIQTDAELAAYNSSFTSGIPNNLKLGDARFKDLDGDGKLEKLPYTLDESGKPTATSGDLVQIGDGGQHYLYGITLGLSWKNFDFSSFFQGVIEWKVISSLNPVAQYFEPQEQYYFHQTWAPDRTDAFWPRLSQSGTIKSYNYQYSDAPFKLYNNRYIRLKNIQVGYTLPKNMTQRLNINKARIYFSGTDIWESDNLPGNLDPETPFALRLSPFPRQYAFGLSLTF